MPKKIQRIEKDGKFYTKKGVELTRASATLTEAQFIAWILSGLRRLTRQWRPKLERLNEGKRPSQSENKRLKWEYSCESCGGWFPQKEIQLDHIVPCGGINGWDKIEGWCRRAFVEKDGYQRLCLSCHHKKTLSEKNNE